MKMQLSALFAVAILVTMTFAVTDPFRTAYVPLEPTELSPHDARLVAEQTAEFCQTGVQPEVQPFVQPDAPTVPVFIYHRVTDADKPSREVIPVNTFKAHLEVLKKLGYNTITVAELTEYMSGRLKLPEKTVALTFDDGWKDNVLAAQLLAEHGMAGTFYIISGAFRNPAYVNEQDVVNISKNSKFEIGSHTHTHFIKWESKMNTLDLCTMAREMVMSKLILERITKKKVQSIAWPYGYNTKEAIHVAHELGYTSTMLVNRDSRNGPGQPPLFMRRLNVDGSCSTKDFSEMLRTGDLKECS
jgi:peptidoglycan/xylan/chitin deacetylase (PgdA/CDA1 family)